MSVKNHPTTETKKPKLHGECWNSFGFLVFWFFVFLVLAVPAFSVELWFFGFLVSVVGWFFTDMFGGLKLDTPEKAD